MDKIIPIIIAYFLGSSPSAYLIAKNRGVNLLSKVENGRLGTASVGRTVGKGAGFLVGAMDFCKGALSVMIADKMSGGEEWVIVLAGTAAIIGHNWSIFLHFLGGKGAATTLAIFLSSTKTFSVGWFYYCNTKFVLRQKSKFSVPGKIKI